MDLNEISAIASRILREQARSRRALVFWAVFPALMLTLFGLIYARGAGTTRSFDATAPGILIGAALFFSCLGGPTALVVSEREKHTLRRLLTTSARPSSYFLGLVAAHVVIALGQAVVVYGIAALFGGRFRGSLALGLAILLLSVFAYTGIGFLFGSRLSRRTEDVNGPVAAFGVPLLVLGGTFFPVSILPPSLLAAAQLDPVFHMDVRDNTSPTTRRAEGRAGRGVVAMKKVSLASLVALLASLAALGETPAEEGIKLYKEGKRADARPLLLEAVAENPRDAAAHAYLGLVYRNLDRDFDKAITEAEKAVELADGNADYHYWLGSCYIAKADGSGMLKKIALAGKSKARWERAIALDPRHVDARLSLVSWYVNAPAIGGGSIAKAKAQAEAVEKIDPFRGNLTLAGIHQREKEWPEAERRYRQAIAVNPKNAGARNSLGYFLLGRARPDEAIAEFKVAVELTPGDANAHDSLAEGYLTAGRVDDAIAEYKAALAINPGFAASCLGLGRCYEKQARWNEARAAYRRVVELQPKGRLADEANGKLKELARKG